LHGKKGDPIGIVWRNLTGELPKSLSTLW